MFGDDLPIKKKTFEFPRILDELSVADLKEYILDLEAEICRVKLDIDKKQASQKAAESFFKS